MKKQPAKLRNQHVPGASRGGVAERVTELIEASSRLEHPVAALVLCAEAAKAKALRARSNTSRVEWGMASAGLLGAAIVYRGLLEEPGACSKCGCALYDIPSGAVGWQLCLDCHGSGSEEVAPAIELATDEAGCVYGVLAVPDGQGRRGP